MNLSGTHSYCVPTSTIATAQIPTTPMKPLKAWQILAKVLIANDVDKWIPSRRCVSVIWKETIQKSKHVGLQETGFRNDGWHCG